MVKTAKLKIYGRVQGVFFRDYTQDKARELNLSGWVKNAPDGTVEALFQGEEKAIKLMIDWCRKGPSSAKVIDVQILRESAAGVYHSFEILL